MNNQLLHDLLDDKSLWYRFSQALKTQLSDTHNSIPFVQD